MKKISDSSYQIAGIKSNASQHWLFVFPGFLVSPFHCSLGYNCGI
jgi:hypothetical protein